MTRKILVSSLLAGFIGAMSTASLAQAARDSITIVGSSTVYPFTTTVAEQFGRQGKFKTPKVESTGTGGGIKLFCDGSASERTMRMSQPYIGRPNDYGILVTTQDKLNDQVADAHAAGWQVGVHANGDVAIDMVLKAYELALRLHPRADPRHRIEHCTLINPGLLKRIAAHDLTPPDRCSGSRGTGSAGRTSASPRPGGRSSRRRSRAAGPRPRRRP